MVSIPTEAVSTCPECATTMKSGKSTSCVLEVMSDSANLVTADGAYSMVTKEDGSIGATGSNVYGQFGDGSTTSATKTVTTLSMREATTDGKALRETH